jgi:hypothetical protein
MGQAEQTERERLQRQRRLGRQQQPPLAGPIGEQPTVGRAHEYRQRLDRGKAQGSLSVVWGRIVAVRRCGAGSDGCSWNGDCCCWRG